jgi:NAD(P)-dependent dehydrogenase (short-subunit alcohol dehydrogenase family)
MAPLIWLVTGTTSGIGAALVAHIVERGDKVIATGRNAEARLGHLKSNNLAVLDLNITAGRQHVQEQITKAWSIFGKIDVLMNNAGASAMKSAEEAECVPFPPLPTPNLPLSPPNTNPHSDTYLTTLLQANFLGHLHVTSAILPLFRSQRSGVLAYTSSSSGWTPLPFMSHYAASKAALTTYVSALDKEVSPLGIRAVSFECGGFPTHLGQPRDANDTSFGEAPAIPEYGPLLGKVVGMFASDMMAFMPGDLGKVGRVVVDVVKGEGVGAGKPWVSHVVVGSDAYWCIKQKCEEELVLLERYREVSFSTDREDHPHVITGQYAKAVSVLE